MEVFQELLWDVNHSCCFQRAKRNYEEADFRGQRNDLSYCRVYRVLGPHETNFLKKVKIIQELGHDVQFNFSSKSS